jgi:hypothetical protein
MADEEEAVTAPVPSNAIEVIVKFGLGRLGFDLHPYGLPQSKKARSSQIGTLARLQMRLG